MSLTSDEIESDLFGGKPEFSNHSIGPVKMIIEDTYKNSLGKKIKKYLNLQRYLHDFEFDEVKSILNKFFSKYEPYLDLTRKAFQNSFQRQYGERVFELVMANFFDSKFKLIERGKKDELDSFPDLEFEFNANRYYVECTTRDSTLISDYVKAISNFDDYFAVAKIFF